MRHKSFLLFRILVSVSIITLLFFIYWSSLLQEERLRSLDNSLQEVKQEISQIKKRGIQQLPAEKNSVRQHIDASLPNLLGVDPYFEKTLPQLLPKGFHPTGTLRLAGMGGTADDLSPFTGWAHISEWQSYCGGSLANLPFGKYEPLVEGFAIKIEERPSGKEDMATFWVHLREDLFWQPLEKRYFSKEVQLAPWFLEKHPVTARDFQFFFQAFKNPNVDVSGAVALRILWEDMRKVEVIDDYTFVVHYQKSLVEDESGKKEYRLPFVALSHVGGLQPLAECVYKYLSNGKKIAEEDTSPDFYEKSSLWAQYFSRHFAKRVIPSCGRWKFDGATDREIHFLRNDDFYSEYMALYKGIEVFMLDSFDAMWRDFMAQKIDATMVSSQNLIELDRFMKSAFYKAEESKGNTINRLNYVDNAVAFVGWNLKNPLFQSKKVRQALAKGVDRKRLIQQNLNGQGIEVTGPFYFNSPSYNHAIQPWPYDPDEAKRMLQEEGWIDRDGDGIIEKIIDGKKVLFSFRMEYYMKNSVTKANAEFIANQLRVLGIQCEPHGVDIQELAQVTDDKSFAAYLLAWAGGSPPENPEQMWSSKNANEKGSSNTIGFANSEADRLIQALKFETNLEKRTKLYFEFHELIHEEAPYLFLYAPKVTYVLWNWIDGVFIPRDRQDLIPGAVLQEPSITYGWKNKHAQ